VYHLNLPKYLETARRRSASLRGSYKEENKWNNEPKPFFDRLLWKLAKSDGDPEEDQLVFTSLNILRYSFLRNKKLCARIIFWSALTSLVGVLSYYFLKCGLEADSRESQIFFLVIAAFFYALTGPSFPFHLTFYDGAILKAVIRKDLAAKIAQKLIGVNRESLRKYLNKNGTPSTLAKSIPDSISSDLLVVVKDPLIWSFSVGALWILSWEYAVALVAGCALILRLAKPAIRKNQKISKDAEKISSKVQITLDSWAQLPRLHSDRGICQSTAQKLKKLTEEEETLYRGNSFHRAWLVAGPRSIGIFLLLASLLPYAVFVKHSETIDVILLASFFFNGFSAFISSIDFTIRVAEMRGELVKLGELRTLPDRPKGNVKMQGFEGFNLQDLQIHYENKTLFPDGLNLSIGTGIPPTNGQPGKSHKVAFVGPSGCGKTSLSRLLARDLEKTDEDNGIWTGECLVRTNGKEYSIDQIDLVSSSQSLISVPQETEVLSAESVERNIELAIEALPLVRRKEIVLRLMKRMQLSLKSLDELCQDQSGGQQKRIQIASALSILEKRIVSNPHPSVILLDEALSQLDQETAVFVLEAIEELADEYGDTIIMIAHSDYAIFDDSYVYVFGPDGQGIIEEGWKLELASNPSSSYNKVFKAKFNPQS
jgi:ABC-type multidrug transport system fused ATPase/permease subunit